jgi:RNA polymerase sigma-70 factor, ECF subfamily
MPDHSLIHDGLNGNHHRSRRKPVTPNDEHTVTGTPLLELYDAALPHVYGYLVRRCDTATAEDLTAETFMAAVVAVQHRGIDVNVAWLIGTARHKLIDHWRRNDRQREALADLWDDGIEPDHSDAAVDASSAHGVLAELPAAHRAVLTLRYLDGLPIAKVAEVIGRSEHATESLLSRAKASFRRTHQPIEETR